MKNDNNGSYIVENVLWSLLAILWYQALVFRRIQGMSYSESKTALWVIAAVSLAFGIYITVNQKRSALNIFVNVVTPFEIYTLLTYSRDMPVLVCVVISAAVLFSGIYCFSLMTKQIKDNDRKKEIIIRRLKQCCLQTRKIAACFLSVIPAFVIVSALSGELLFSPSVTAEIGVLSEEKTAEVVLKSFSMPDENTWRGMSASEKLDILQLIANSEAYYLGLPHELNVRLDCLSNPALASYDDKDHIISVDIDHFDNAPFNEVLDSICHEAFHAYQHRLCDVYDSLENEYKGLPIFSDIEHYKREFSDYVSGHDDISQYRRQKCEEDARSYARNAVLKYLTK